jgi:hypothetical protein
VHFLSEEYSLVEQTSFRIHTQNNLMRKKKKEKKSKSSSRSNKQKRKRENKPQLPFDPL